MKFGMNIEGKIIDDCILVKYSKYREEFSCVRFKDRRQYYLDGSEYYSFSQLLTVSQRNPDSYSWYGYYANTDVNYGELRFGQILRLQCDISGYEIVAMICSNNEYEVELCKKLIVANLSDGFI